MLPEKWWQTVFTIFGKLLLIVSIFLYPSRQATSQSTPDQSQIQLLDHVGGPALAIAVKDDYAYLGFAYELAVVDISDPFYPTRVGYALMPISDLAFCGDFLCVAGEDGLRIVSIKDTSQPEVVGFFRNSQTADVAVQGDFAYLTEGDGLFHVVNIANPEQPTRANSLWIASTIEDIKVSGDYAYLASDAGMDIINIADPENPQRAGLFITPTKARGVEIASGHAYLAIENALIDFDLQNPAEPVRLNTLFVPGVPGEMALSGDLLFVANNILGLYLFDISDQDSPSQVGVLQIDGAVMNVAISGNFAYLADAAGGMRTVYINNPRCPVEASTLITLGIVWDVKIADNYAFVATDFAPTLTSALTVIDISNQKQCEVTSSCALTGSPRDLTLDGDFVYLPTINSGLNQIDIHNPQNPLLAQLTAMEGVLHNSCRYANSFYVTGSRDVLHYVEGSDPAQSATITNVQTDIRIWDMKIVDHYGLAAAGLDGLQVMDMSDPLAPVMLTTIDTPGYAVGLAISEDTAYVADSTGGLQIVDIAEITKPALIGSLITGIDCQSVAIQGNHAYVAAGQSGLYVVDVSDSAEPTIIDHYDTLGYALNVVVVGETVYIADHYGGLYVLSFPLHLTRTTG